MLRSLGNMLLRNATGALSLVRRKRRDIHEANDVRVISCLCDDGASIRMSHQQDRSALLSDHLAGTLDVIGQRRQWQFHSADRLVTLACLFDDDLAPMRSAAPKAMH